MKSELPDHGQELSGPLILIDRAVAAAKAAAHACSSEIAREHFEFALALLGESWIAESGQQARNADQVITDVRQALNLFAAVFEKEGAS